MVNYKIKWEIDIEADSPEEAVGKALEIQRDVESLANIFEVTDSEGNVKEIDVLAYDNGVDNIRYVNKVIKNHGEFSTFDVEAEDSPTVTNLGNVMQLAEDFHEGYATCTTYIGSREESQQDVSYEDLLKIDPFILEHIASLAENWEAESLKTEKRVSD